MKNISVTIVLGLFALVFTYGQGCLPEGITFSSQAQIDNFSLNYPGCTVIGGNVKILGDDIINLDSLIVLTSIEGDLDIGECWSIPNGNPVLMSLSGLANLTNVGGSLLICQNHILNSLDGLDNMTQVEGQLYISDHSNLINISALGNLMDIGGNLIVKGNQTLLDLTGLEGLENIDGTLNVWFNNSLVDLNGLDNISSIGGNLGIEGNEILNNLEGLETLSFVEGDVIIGCIYGWMHHNPSIKSLSGLNNLSIIGGSLWINLNDSLLNLTGLENLTSIGESIIIEGNQMLTDLTGIENLFTIGNGIIISHNDLLISLTGLDNIDENTVEGIYINDNMTLTKCEILSICEYLTIPNANVDIQDNASGCNSQEEVEEACDSQGIGAYRLPTFTLHPNPADNGSINITLDTPHNLHLTCFNTFGQQVHHQEIRSAETVIDVSTCAPGIYLAVMVEEGKPVGRRKFVVR